MKFAICNELFQSWPMEQAFAHAAQIGYRGIEIAPFTLGAAPTKISAPQRQTIRELAAVNDLQIVGLHWLLAQTSGFHLTHPNRDIRTATADYLCELVRLCESLGGRVLVLGSPQQRNLDVGTSYETGFDRAVETLRQIRPALAEHQVTLAIEPLGPEEGNFLLTAQSAIELAQAIDSPQVQLHLDVKAMSTESLDIPTIIKRSQNWLAHFHANDPNRRGPGMGAVDFAPIAAALRSIDYDGWVSVEVFDYSPGIETLAVDSINYLQQVWASAEKTP